METISEECRGLIESCFTRWTNSHLKLKISKPLSLFFKLVKCGCFTRVFNQAAQKITTTTVSQFESQAATIRANQI